MEVEVGAGAGAVCVGCGRSDALSLNSTPNNKTQHTTHAQLTCIPNGAYKQPRTRGQTMTTVLTSQMFERFVEERLADPDHPQIKVRRAGVSAVTRPPPIPSLHPRPKITVLRRVHRGQAEPLQDAAQEGRHGLFGRRHRRGHRDVQPPAALKLVRVSVFVYIYMCVYN